jgi:hypothetical protein
LNFPYQDSSLVKRIRVDENWSGEDLLLRLEENYENYDVVYREKVCVTKFYPDGNEEYLGCYILPGQD